MPSSLRPVFLVGLAGLAAGGLASLGGPASASDPAANHPSDAAAEAGPAIREPCAGDGYLVPDAYLQAPLPLPEEVAGALRSGAWSEAADGLLAVDPGRLVGSLRADHAFVTAWSLVHAGRAAEAASWRDRMAGARVAAPWQDLVRAETLAAEGEPLAALSAVEAIPEDHLLAERAAVVGAEALQALGRTQEAGAVYQSLDVAGVGDAARAFARLQLARRAGHGSPRSEALLRAVWAEQAGSREAWEAEKLLDAHHPGWEPTDAERVTRAERRMGWGAYDDALALTDDLSGAHPVGGSIGCRVAWVRGRSLYKRNRLSDALEAFGDAGAACVGVDGVEGHKILYLEGLAHFRKGSYRQAAEAYGAIAALYPETTYADDGLTRAGIAWFEADEPDRALDAWREALERFPSGDTVPEAAFRRAFTLYDTGRTTEAIAVAEALGALDPAQDEVHVFAGRYWAARWRLYPDAAAPRRAVADARAREEALERWTDLARAFPRQFYGALAWSRVLELDPDAALDLSRLDRPEPACVSSWRAGEVPGLPRHDPEAPFTGRDATPAEAEAAALLAVGLVREALAVRPDPGPAPHVHAAWNALRAGTGDLVGAHKAMHDVIRDHPVGTMPSNEDAVVRQAYPDLFLDEVRAATAEAGIPTRLFHALCREESTFDPDIRSHAGARGLAQLMPATGKGVARKLGLSVSTGQLTDPALNTRLGARYLADMLARYDGNPALALGAYNAGPGRIDQWLGERGDLPLDEFVERIPFRETRGYVKRVLSTYAVMHWTYEGAARLAAGEPRHVDLSRFNHDVTPGR